MKKPINLPNVSNLDPSYWEKVLDSHQLNMKAGVHKVKDGRRRIVPAGSLTNLTNLAEKVSEGRFGCGGGRRVKPKGHGPN